MDEETLIGEHAPRNIDLAVPKTQISIVLYSRELFVSHYAKQELRWILANWLQGRTMPLPVFLGISPDECARLVWWADFPWSALPWSVGLTAISQATGLRHADERIKFTSMPVSHERTMNKIIKRVCMLTGIRPWDNPSG